MRCWVKRPGWAGREVIGPGREARVRCPSVPCPDVPKSLEQNQPGSFGSQKPALPGPEEEEEMEGVVRTPACAVRREHLARWGWDCPRLCSPPVPAPCPNFLDPNHSGSPVLCPLESLPLRDRGAEHPSAWRCWARSGREVSGLGLGSSWDPRAPRQRRGPRWDAATWPPAVSPLRLLPEPPAKPEGTGSDRGKEISQAVPRGAPGARLPPRPPARAGGRLAGVSVSLRG